MSSLRQRVSLRRVRQGVQLALAHTENWLYATPIGSVKELYLPDFLGIGAQRSVTTWLYENLRQHPQIFIPEQKELHYFDRNFSAGLRYYSYEFQAGRGKVKGEITPAYGHLSPGKIRLVRRVVPDVKLIFFMRNPIDRAWSQALMNLVDLPGKRMAEVDDSEFYSHFRSRRSMERGDYETILDNWLSVFPSKVMYIGFFEDIIHRPRELLGEIFAHIGVSTDVDWGSIPYDRAANKGLRYPMPKQYREFLEEMYCRDIELLYKRFGGPIAFWRCSQGT
jgi:hypothetical protein